MSRGPGRVGRAIRALMRADPDGAWTTEDLADAAYPDADAIERRHRVSVLSAAHRMVAGDPDWALRRGDAPGDPVILYDRSSALGVALADLKGDPFEGYRRRGPFALRRTDEADLHAMLAPGGAKHHLVEPGGPCHRQARRHATRRDGDGASVAEMQAVLANFPAMARELVRLRAAMRATGPSTEVDDQM